MTDAAVAAVHELIATDASFTAAGMELICVTDGAVTLALTIRAEMTNGGGLAHGGWIFLLADTAFAFAATTRMRGALTTDADIRFHRPAREGDRIVAEAVAVETTATSLLVDVIVTGAGGERIASFRAAGRAPRTPSAQ